MNEEEKDTKKTKKENKNEKIIKDLNDKIALLEDKNIRVQAGKKKTVHRHAAIDGSPEVSQ